jgi:hypothetical protein
MSLISIVFRAQGLAHPHSPVERRGAFGRLIRMSRPHQPVQNIFRVRQASIVGRGEASDLARRDPKRAMEVAHRIPDGWYRCQAFATIARHAPDDLSEEAFRQAQRAAAESFDNYQRAGVLAFAITAAFERGRRDLAEAMLADAFDLVPSIEPMASRAYALNLLWSTIAHHGDGRLRGRVIEQVQAHVHPDRSWRARFLYREIADWLAERDPRKAQALVAAMPDGKARAYLERRYGSNL